jgi:hypothetical protein
MVKRDMWVSESPWLDFNMFDSISKPGENTCFERFLQLLARNCYLYIEFPVNLPIRASLGPFGIFSIFQIENRYFSKQ